ncbi:MAG: 16S rRNA pseudouridine(516) synthase, partial [Bdellovibrionota bacterium]
LKKAEQHITLSPDLCERMLVDGEPLEPLPGLHLMLHKPLGYTCSRKEEEGKLVYELFPERWQLREPALSTVGRLDKDTSGLLLLTDDGALLHKITSPKFKVWKRYSAKLARPLRGDEEKLFASGDMMLDGEKKPLAPARLEVHSPTSASLLISEGRYHQVRRMFAAAGNEVVELHRVSLGGLELPADLAVGEFRVISAEEISRIFSEA